MGFLRTNDLSEIKTGELNLDFGVWLKTGKWIVSTENKMKKNKKKNSLKHWATRFKVLG